MRVVAREEWMRTRRELLAKEKELLRLRDELSGAIRDMPAREVTKSYAFQGGGGPTVLSELFGDRDRLIVYHFMFGPEWKEGCKSCSFLMDHVAPSTVHIRDRGVEFAIVSRGPIDRILAFRERMGWEVNWVSSLDSDFNEDFDVSVTERRAASGEMEYNYAPDGSAVGTEHPGLSVFTRDSDRRIFHTYSTYARGLDGFIGAYRLLDIVPGGRNEEGLSYGMEWVRHHDRYDE